jgi:hypothetical protein
MSQNRLPPLEACFGGRCVAEPDVVGSDKMAGLLSLILPLLELVLLNFNTGGSLAFRGQVGGSQLLTAHICE